MKCPMCKGSGKRHYILAGRNADGSTTAQGMAYAYDDVLDWLDRNAKEER